MIYLSIAKTWKKVLMDNQLLAKASKCEFGFYQVEYLGNVITDCGVKAKLLVMQEWPTPTSVKSL